MQFPPIKKGGNNPNPNQGSNVGGAGGAQGNNENYVKNIKKNP